MKPSNQLSEAISSASILSAIGMNETTIMEFIKEEEGITDQKEIDFIFKSKALIRENYLNHQQLIQDILEKDDHENLENEIHTALSKAGVHAELIEHVSTTGILSMAVRELEPIITEMIKNGASQDEVLESLTEQGVDGDYVPVLYNRILSEIPNNQVKTINGYSGWTILVAGIFWSILGMWMAPDFMDDDSGRLLTLGFLVAGFGAIAFGLWRISRH